MAAPTSPAHKTERLLNLVICLLYTRQPLAKQQIRAAVPQYAEVASDESFDRMFERDKDELRDLGIPLRTEAVDAFFDDETGYRIDQREYALPEITFEADELTVLGLAARTWQQASLGGPAAQAMRKLRAQDVTRDEASVLALEPRVRTTEAAFEPMKNAALRHQEVRFGYRKGRGAPEERRLQPWAVTSWHGHWYVTGFDLDRDAPRVFRLSRVAGAVRTTGRPGAYAVPDDHDAVAMIAASTDAGSTTRARLQVRVGAGNTLRRSAADVRRVDDDWDELTVERADLGALVAEVCGFGPAVLALDPPELVEQVAARLDAVVAANGGAS